MYCSNCGTKNVGNNFCINCGNRLDNVSNNIGVKKTEINGLRTASILLGAIAIVGSIVIILSPISIILSIIGLILAIVATKKGKNVLGIVLNVVGIVLSIAILFIIGVFIYWIDSVPIEMNECYDCKKTDSQFFDKYREYY